MDRSRSFSAGVTLQDPLAGQRQPNGAPPAGTAAPGALDYVSGLSGSYARSILEGRTLATIGQGSVTVRGQTGEQTNLQLAGINRDASTNQIMTRDDSFRTGNLELDVGALRRAGDNVAAIGNRFAEARRTQSEIEQSAQVSAGVFTDFYSDEPLPEFLVEALDLPDDWKGKSFDQLVLTPKRCSRIRMANQLASLNLATAETRERQAAFIAMLEFGDRALTRFRPAARKHAASA